MNPDSAPAHSPRKPLYAHLYFQVLVAITIGVVYSVSMIVLLASIGVLFFGEKLNYYEIAGLAMAIGSMVLLSRFN